METDKTKILMASKLKVFILTEGGKETGYGHLVRCLALNDAFRERGSRPRLVIHGDSSVRAIMAGRRYATDDWKTAGFLRRLAGADIVIVDSYLAKKNVYERFSRVCKLLVCLDDYNRLQYPAGVVLNGAVQPGQLPYKRYPGSAYLLGYRYQPFRREFWSAPQKKINAECRKVLVSVGANDNFKLLPTILQALTVHYPKLEKCVLVGKTFDRTSVADSVSGGNTRWYIGPSPKMLKALMLEADIAISAGGQTLCELARIGVPSIAVVVADNQEGNVRNLMRYGLVRSSVKISRGPAFSAGLRRAVGGLLDKRVREKCSSAGRRILDGGGASRVAGFLLDRLVETGERAGSKEAK